MRRFERHHPHILSWVAWNLEEPKAQILFLPEKFRGKFSMALLPWLSTREVSYWLGSGSTATVGGSKMHSHEPSWDMEEGAQQGDFKENLPRSAVWRHRLCSGLLWPWESAEHWHHTWLTGEEPCHFSSHYGGFPCNWGKNSPWPDGIRGSYRRPLPSYRLSPFFPWSNSLSGFRICGQGAEGSNEGRHKIRFWPLCCPHPKTSQA